jgi:drug/metabolite transporter (DMT)-like permease
LAPHRKGLALAFAGGMLLTFDAPLLKAARTDLWTMIFVRGLMIAAAMTFYWFAFTRQRDAGEPFIKGKEGTVLAVMLWAGNLLFMSAITYTTVANVVFILAFNPLIAAILSRLLLGEKIAPATIGAIAVATAGVAIIVWDGIGGGTWLGDGLALACAIQVAVSITYTRASGKNLVTSAALGALLSALSVAAFAQPFSLSGEGLFWLSLNGLLFMPLANAFLTLSPRYLSAPEVALFFLLESCITPLWMWTFLSEVPSKVGLTGGAIVVTAIFVLSVLRLSTPQSR